jgi:hypothetical protein
VGKRKDGRDRVKLTLLVTPESISGAREVSPSVSAAFEAVFEPEKEEDVVDLGVSLPAVGTALSEGSVATRPAAPPLQSHDANTDTP